MNNLQHIFNCLKTNTSINSDFIERNLHLHDEKFYSQNNSSNLVYAENPHSETSLALSTAFFYCLSHSFDTIETIELEIFSPHILEKKQMAEHLQSNQWNEFLDENTEKTPIYSAHNIYFRPNTPTHETMSLLQKASFNQFKKATVSLTNQDIKTYFKNPYQQYLLTISENTCLNQHFMARLSQINSTSYNNLHLSINRENFSIIMNQYFSQETQFLNQLLYQNDHLIDYSKELKRNIFSQTPKKLRI